MKQVKLYLVVVAAFLCGAASFAVAADTKDWSGRDVKNRRVFWTCSNVGGNDWKLKKNGRTVGDYEGVTSTREFVELRLKGSKEFDRVRLYKDHLSMNKEGSRTEWIEIAKGKWTK